MRDKKAQTQLLIILTVFASVISIASYMGILDTASLIGGESIYKANYGHICCEEGAYESPYIRYADDVPTYTCNSYTDECRIQFILGDRPWNYCNNIEYDINGQVYEKSWSDVSDVTLKYGDKITFRKSFCATFTDNRKYYQYSAQYRKFYIQGEENGKIFVAKSCILDTGLKGRVESDGLNELSKTGINRCQNYITDYIFVTTNTYDYHGKEVICQSRNIYDIDTINLLDGNSRRIQGQRIKGVDCCPHESNCNNNFEFNNNVVKECSYDYECANAGDPVAITGTSYVLFGCNNNKCSQSSPIDVECTNNAVCVDKYNKPNMVCKNFKCESDDAWLGHCGDKICESIIGETPTSCPNDCGEWEKPGINWVFILFLILAIVGLIVFYRPLLSIIKSTLGRFGIR